MAGGITLEGYTKNTALQVGLLAAILILYVLTKISLFGLLFAVALIGTVALEVWGGAKSRGWKEEAKDTLVSLGGILILWVALTFILNSPVPINAVVSCSMLPNVERGDLILVQGAEPLGYEVDVSEEGLAALSSPGAVVYAGSAGSFTLNGSLWSYCAQKADTICSQFTSSPEMFREVRGPFTFNYGTCERRKGALILETPCVTSVDFSGKNYLANLSHDTIVYSPASGDLYSYTGDIIHRVYFRVNSGGETYYLTKGDNNPVFDIQVYDYALGMGNRPPSSEQFRGKILLRIPFLGYPKLFISGFFSETVNCDSTLGYPALS